MQPTILATVFALSRAALSMSAVAVALLVVALLVAKNEIAQASGLDKIAVLANLCFGLPLAVFGTEHFCFAQAMTQMVPSYMPWHLFWIYFVGVALIAAGLSIATRIQVQWSGLLFGVMMFFFVGMMDIPGALAGRDRISCTLALREAAFGSGGWVLAGTAMGASRGGKSLITVGRLIIAVAAIFYGVEHFLHPLGLPGVPLEKEIPTWIPARAFIDYLTGAFLIVGGVFMLLGRKTRVAATCLGGWIVLMVLLIYSPVLIGALANPSTDVQVEGLNYFFDTLLFGGVVLSLGRVMDAD